MNDKLADDTIPLEDEYPVEDREAKLTDSDLATISNLANSAMEIELEVSELTEKLQDALRRYTDITDFQLPNAMVECGVSEFTLTNGRKVEITKRLIGSQLDDPEGIAWVKAHGGEALVKTVVLLELPADMLDEAQRVYDMLREDKVGNQAKKLTLTQSVHQSTIAAFAREQLEAGARPPLDKLRVFEKRSSRVMDGKRRRSRTKVEFKNAFILK